LYATYKEQNEALMLEGAHEKLVEMTEKRIEKVQAKLEKAREKGKKAKVIGLEGQLAKLEKVRERLIEEGVAVFESTPEAEPEAKPKVIRRRKTAKASA
jgi:ribosomal 50S subunit-associated protein YjgA (DUF615 family)